MVTGPDLVKEYKHKPGDPESLDVPEDPGSNNLVGMKIRAIRSQRHLSLRKLAERSGLNINTLSLVENGKSSPSVSTLQHLARALKVPITAFFEAEPDPKQVVFVRHNQGPRVTFESIRLEHLGKDLDGHAIQPFVVVLEPGGGSGSQMIVHTGHEFVYCLAGKVLYWIDEVRYELGPGDSLVFESYLPHRWENLNTGESHIILVIIPADRHESPGGHHFQPASISLWESG
jgi:transcriptional regulator with XRE-family HTH domain